jgi:hypothetical protein
MNKPAHKNLENPPGQIVNPVGNYSGVITPAKTLQDQIDRHTQQDEKKLTFEEWYLKEYGDLDMCTHQRAARRGWEAGQRNV